MDAAALAGDVPGGALPPAARPSSRSRRRRPGSSGVLAGVKNLQANLFGLAGNLLFVVGLWRCGSTAHYEIEVVFFEPGGAPVPRHAVPAAYHLQHRPQPVLLPREMFLTEILDGVNFVVSTFVIVEMAESATRDWCTVCSRRRTTSAAVWPRARQPDLRRFELSLDDAQNYVATAPPSATPSPPRLRSRTSSLRRPAHAAAAARQKEEARRKRVAAAHAVRRDLVGSASRSAYSLTINFLSCGGDAVPAHRRRPRLRGGG